MVRLAVLCQLIASLLVGPLLCCCAATRLGHATRVAAKSDATGTPGQRKSCCGRQETPPPGSPQAPDGEDSPTQCPCKGHTQSALTVPEAATAVSLSSDAATFEFAPPTDVVGGSRNPSPASACSTSRFCSRTKSETLFARHNLRC